jgi:oligo-1,6-glucosidase/alpha-glucosidase
MTQNHPDNFGFARELRELTDEYGAPERVLIGETFGSPHMVRRYCGDEKHDRLHLAFLFQGMDTPFRAGRIRGLIREYEHWFPPPFLPTWVFSNHDRYRRFSQLGEHHGKAKLNAALQLTGRGVPCIYYGEELGMRQGRIPVKRTRDGLTRYLRPLPAPLIKLGNRFTGGAVQRDGSRTPMQWSGAPHAGFTLPEAQPWMPLNTDYRQVNVEEERQDEHSLFNCYRRFLSYRQKSDALQRGALTLLSAHTLPRGVTGFLRHTEEELLLVLFNLKDSSSSVSLSAERLGREIAAHRPGEQHSLLLRSEVSTHRAAMGRVHDRELVLLPWEGTVWRLTAG